MPASVCHAAGLTGLSLETNSQPHLCSLSPTPQQFNYSCHAGRAPRCQLQARQAPRRGLRLHQRGHQLQLGLCRGQLLCLLSQRAALGNKALHRGTRLPCLAPLCMSSTRLSGTWTKHDKHSLDLLRQCSLLWDSTPDGGPSGVSGLHEQQGSSVAAGIQHGKLSLARLSHGSATGILHRVVWPWHGSAPSGPSLKGQQVNGQCITALSHCTLPHQQATSVGKQAVHGPAAPLDGHQNHPAAMQAVHNGLHVATLCSISRPPDSGQAVQGLPDLALLCETC